MSGDDRLISIYKITNNYNLYSKIDRTLFKKGMEVEPKLGFSCTIGNQLLAHGKKKLTQKAGYKSKKNR